MFRFQDPFYLIVSIVVICAMLMVFWIYRRRQSILRSRFADESMMRKISVEASVKRINYKFYIFLCAVILILVALARPQFGSKLREQSSNGVEVIIATDVSNSMLAEDFKPNRLERTKSAIMQLLSQLKDHRIGLIVFAGDAFVQLPVTSDFMAARGFVNGISPSMVPVPGTSLSSAIDLASRSYSSSSDKSRVLILVTDGESHDDDPLAAAKQAYENGITIYTIGIGTPQGAPLSIGGQMVKDENGDIVVSKLNEEILQQIAKQGNGLYVRASESQLGLQDILNNVDNMQKQEFSSKVFDEYNDQFHYLLIIALALLVLEFFMMERKNKVFRNITVFEKESDDDGQ